jgi:hypothetical protein
LCILKNTTFVKVSGVVGEQAAADELFVFPGTEQASLGLLELVGGGWGGGFDLIETIPEGLGGEALGRESP